MILVLGNRYNRKLRFFYFNDEKNKDFLYRFPYGLEEGTRKNKKVNKVKTIKYWTEKIDEIDKRLKNNMLIRLFP